MTGKIVNIINFANIETIYRRREGTGTFKVLEFIGAMPKVELQTITHAYDLKDVLDKVFATLDEDQEHLILLILNVAGELRGYKVIASGGQDYVDMDPRVVFRNALLLGAARIILAHNHPAGSANPSPQDIGITRKLAFLGELLNLELVDHVIWTPDELVSIRKRSPGSFQSKPE